jgi:hypothetical protein
MNRIAMELYLYMGNSSEIIKWLESEGVKTKDDARSKLEPLVESNILDVERLGAGSLHGTSKCVKKVLEYFPN